jgi:transposase-like protein
MSDKRKVALEAKLDGRQIKAALLCVEREFAAEEDRAGFEEIAQEIGVTRKTLHQWRTQKRAFIDYVNYLADDFLAADRAKVYRQLMRSIDGSQPSIKAIDLYFRRFGLITNNLTVETKDAGSARSNDELAAELTELDELLADVEQAEDDEV